jgi:hypothetical protein
MDSNSTKLASLDATVSSRAPSATALSTAVWTGTKAAFLDAAVSSAGGGGLTAGAIADAVWDENRTGHITAGTFGSYLDAAISGVSTGGISAGDIADAIIEEFASTPPSVNLAPTGLDAIPMTLLDEPSNFREWAVWLFSCRFVRSRRVKGTGIFSVYGSDRSTVVSRQTTTDNSTETTVGAFE